MMSPNERLLLDTSAYSDFMRGHPAAKSAVQRADEIYFTPIILGELLAGFKKGTREKANEKELETFLSSPRVKVVGIQEETAERYAVILTDLRKSGTPIPTNDIWISASAMEHGLPVLTADRHYQRVPHILVHFYASQA